MKDKNNEYTEEFLDEQLYFTEEIYKQYTKEEVFKELNKLEDAIAFRNVSNMPARVKCVLLAWHTMEDLLEKNGK